MTAYCGKAHSAPALHWGPRGDFYPAGGGGGEPWMIECE